MFKFIKIILTLIPLLSISHTSLGKNIECVELRSGTGLSVELNQRNFENCFILNDVKENSNVNFAIYSPDDITNNIRLYNVLNGEREYIAEYNSGNNSENGFQINSTNRKLSFSVIPTNKTSTYKGLSINYISIDNSSNIIINLQDIKSKRFPLKPPVFRHDGDCRFIGGRQVCEDLR